MITVEVEEEECIVYRSCPLVVFIVEDLRNVLVVRVGGLHYGVV